MRFAINEKTAGIASIYLEGGDSPGGTAWLSKFVRESVRGRMYFQVYRLLEAIQYGVLYIFVAFFAGVGLDFAFPIYEKEKSSLQLLNEVFWQSLALVVVVFLVRGLVKAVPVLFPVPRGIGYVPYTTSEYSGELMIGLILLSCQLNLIAKIDELSQRLYMAMYNKERKIKRDL